MFKVFPCPLSVPHGDRDRDPVTLPSTSKSSSLTLPRYRDALLANWICPDTVGSDLMLSRVLEGLSVICNSSVLFFDRCKLVSTMTTAGYMPCRVKLFVSIVRMHKLGEHACRELKAHGGVDIAESPIWKLDHREY